MPPDLPPRPTPPPLPLVALFCALDRSAACTFRTDREALPLSRNRRVDDSVAVVAPVAAAARTGGAGRPELGLACLQRITTHLHCPLSSLLQTGPPVRPSVHRQFGIPMRRRGQRVQSGNSSCGLPEWTTRPGATACGVAPRRPAFVGSAGGTSTLAGGFPAHAAAHSDAQTTSVAARMANSNSKVQVAHLIVMHGRRGTENLA